MDDKPTWKTYVAIVAAVYVFVLVPGGLLGLYLAGKLDLQAVSNFLGYSQNVINSPVGEYLWDAPTGANYEPTYTGGSLAAPKDLGE